MLRVRGSGVPGPQGPQGADGAGANIPPGGLGSGDMLAWDGTDWVAGHLTAGEGTTQYYITGAEQIIAPFGLGFSDGTSTWWIGPANTGVLGVRADEGAVVVTASPPILTPAGTSSPVGGPLIVLNMGANPITYATSADLVLKTADIRLVTGDSLTVCHNGTAYIEVGRSILPS